jgi:hypothetical protein
MEERRFAVVLVILVAASMPACSSDSGKRAVYESLRSREQQDCLRDPSSPPAGCQKRERYDDYRRQRAVLEAK